MFNEIIVLIIGVHEMVLLGFINNKEPKEIVGNSMVFFILFMIFVCILISALDFLT
jgi:hypothetical protein